jgi:hypothetical protein
MNVILEILGNDISSIIYNYLTINKIMAKSNSIKNLMNLQFVQTYHFYTDMNIIRVIKYLKEHKRELLDEN